MSEKKLQILKTLVCRLEGEDELVKGDLFLHEKQIIWYLVLKHQTLKKEEKHQILWNGKKENLFDRIGEIAFGCQGQKVSYTANQGGEIKNDRFCGGKWILVNDGELSAEYDMIQNLTFDAQGQLSYWANLGGIDNSYEFYGGKWHLFYRGEQSQPFDDAGLMGPIFGAKGKLAYGGRFNEKYYWLLNHIQHQGFDEIGPLVFSADEAHYAYFAREGNHWQAVLDGKPGSVYDEVSDLSFSVDGKWLAYRGKREGKWFFILNQKERFALPWLGKICFSPSGAHFATEGKDSSGVFVAVNGKKGPVFDHVELHGFSQDGKKLFYRGRKQGQWSWLMNHQPVFNGEEAGELLFCDTGEHFAFLGKKNGIWEFYRDGVRFLQGELLEKAFFSAHGKETAVIGKEGHQQYLVIGKTKGPYFDQIHQVLCHPEKNLWIYTAENRGKWFFVANHQILDPDQDYQQILGLEYCAQENCFIGLAVKNKWVYTVKI